MGLWKTTSVYRNGLSIIFMKVRMQQQIDRHMSGIYVNFSIVVENFCISNDHVNVSIIYFKLCEIKKETKKNSKTEIW